jgi:hypothetical protein
MQNHLWTIMDIQEGVSPKHGGKLYTINLVGIQDKESYVVYVSPKNRNFKYWSKYIATMNKGYILSDLIMKKDHVVNADHAPKIEITYNTKEELAQELEDIWQQ